MQIYSQFYKTDTIEVFYSLQSTKPENFRSKTWATRHHAPLEGLEISASMNTHSHAPPSSFTHSHTLVISHVLTRAMMSSSTNRLTRLIRRPGLTRPTRKFDPDPNCLPKKKKMWKKIPWPSRPLTLTKKSKISKRTCPTQNILILGPISSFEARKLCKRPISKKLTFVQILTKRQNF